MKCQDEIRASEPPPLAIKERDNEGPQGHGGSEERATVLESVAADCAHSAWELRTDFKRLPARTNGHFAAPRLAHIKDAVTRMDEEQLMELLDALEGRFCELAGEERKG